MPQFRNRSPLGALDVPIARRIVPFGEVIDLPADAAQYIATQAETWEPVDDEARAIVLAMTTPADSVEPTPADSKAPPSATDSADSGAETGGKS